MKTVKQTADLFRFIFLVTMSISCRMAYSAGACADIEELNQMSILERRDRLMQLPVSTIRQIKISAGICKDNARAKMQEKRGDPEDQKSDSAAAVEKAADNALDDKLGLKAFNFAVGLGVMHVSKADINTATIDNGVIRVTDEEKQKLGLWLSTSTFFDTFLNDKYRWGMFLGAQLGGDNKVLNGLATGFAFGSTKSVSSSKEGVSPLVFQLGWGWARVQKLADGYVDGQAPPTGASQPLLKKTTADGPVLIISYNFF